MSGKMLIIGVFLGVGLMAVGAMVYGGAGSPINADKVCSERFGAEWTGEQIEMNPDNQTAMLECTNGTATEVIGVEVEVNV